MPKFEPMPMPYYVLDKDLPDDPDIPWGVHTGICGATFTPFILVCRSDKEALCPICHADNPRVTRIEEEPDMAADTHIPVQA